MESDAWSQQRRAAMFSDAEVEDELNSGVCCGTIEQRYSHVVPARARGSGLPALTINIDQLLPNCLPYVEPTSLCEIMVPNTAVVDVRTAEERCDGYISGSLHIPADEWDDALERGALPQSHGLTSATHIVFYCMYSRERGPRSAQAAAILAPELQISIVRGLPELPNLEPSLTCEEMNSPCKSRLGCQ